ncbi:Permease of the drug/metabolite transporter (DMT) superfamily [Paracoccus halophilus]|uniref:Permease of the drug/metabolite transporter (DMT) superfamily n=1 Tax=Paracoccus halophilus TaxID=376733 RepID=A0A099F923_9RHOB|nr:DMT family transporter [Paracoccus halophilus]KGJ06741.1 RhaT family transporter [Paracoccus halophilus]SFA41867.1 Permease of the drug/metabolite transporter (DMT) superfamily [Paracoccus halophilus]
MPENPQTGPLMAPAAQPPAVPPPQARPRIDRQGMAIVMICASAFIFAAQDGISRYLGAAYSPIFVIMLRYWFFAVFVVLLCARAPGGLSRAMRTKRPWTQAFRGVLLAAEVLVTVEAFVRLGLINTHAIFACYPLLISALSGPVLGEKVGWRRWAAVAAGFLGILIVLNPGSGALSANASLPLGGAVMFAVYGLLTRLVARDDPAMVSFFWTGIAGAIAITLVGIWYWEPIAPRDIPWLLLLCLCAAVAHFMLIKAYELAEASALQPFSYTQLVWVSIFGVTLFGETLAPNVAIGGAIVVGAGMFTWWRSRQRERAETG